VTSSAIFNSVAWNATRLVIALSVLGLICLFLRAGKGE